MPYDVKAPPGPPRSGHPTVPRGPITHGMQMGGPALQLQPARGHLASTCIRQGVGMAWGSLGGPLEHLPSLSFFQQARICGD